MPYIDGYFNRLSTISCNAGCEIPALVLFFDRLYSFNVQFSL